MADRKPCKVCNFSRQKSYGLVVPSLEELKTRGCEFFGFTASDDVTVVLEDDGTIVEDEGYFLCLPSNTKFMLLHERETWSPLRRVDGGTAWMARESMIMDAIDAATAGDEWLVQAQQLKQDLASIFLMSEADLQNLVDAPVSELAPALGFSVPKAENFQEKLQGVLDRREEERQSKELLQLYLKAVEREEGEQAEEPSQKEGDMVDGSEADQVCGFMSRTLMVLKGKTSPETRLSTEDLQLVLSRGVEVMEQVLGWDKVRTAALITDCTAELNKRLGKIQAVQSIRTANSQQTNDDSGSEEMA
ncbi:DNA fragmentation factor subunit alpha [Synchiropus splendidus]|uniref:DNA fragmentation factor subunit alpha n=1 Tax=Synchiropus splendidus TaxID=270530 RepID=UPI00237EAA54|nr:DNA fragmentation factor subunit alpha [Synchiropus splendidus]